MEKFISTPSFIAGEIPVPVMQNYSELDQGIFKYVPKEQHEEHKRQLYGSVSPPVTSMSDYSNLDQGMFKYVPKEQHEEHKRQLYGSVSPPVTNTTESPNFFNIMTGDNSSDIGTIDRKAIIDTIISEIDDLSWLIYYKFEIYMLYNITYVKYVEMSFRMNVYRFGLSKGITLTSTEVSTIISELKLHQVEFDGEPDAENITLFKNCYVDNNTGYVVSNVINYFPTVYVKADYEPNKQPYHPKFDAFLMKISNNDPLLVKRFWEVIGYTLSSDCQAKRFFVLVGEKGNNGKSTFLEFLERLFPENAVSHMSIQDMFSSRFALSNLHLKRLNISSDEGYCNLSSEQIGELKRITGGKDRITGDVKYGTAISFKPTCKLFLASNFDLSSSYAASGQAIVNRMCKIPFDAVISNSEKDPYIVEKLLAEKNAIVTDAFKAYIELRNRSYIFTGNDIYDIKYLTPGGDSYSKVEHFINSRCDFSDENAFSTTNKLYEAFKDLHGNCFADKTGFSQCFNKVCECLGHNIEKKRVHTASENTWGFTGVNLF